MKHEKEEVSGETLRAKGGFNQSREAEEKDGWWPTDAFLRNAFQQAERCTHGSH